MKSIQDFLRSKQRGQKITMVTCYDYTSAEIVARSKIDCILVGDSSSMVMHGASNTTESTLDQIRVHTRSVARVSDHPFLIADLPFMSYRKSLKDTMCSIEILVRSGAQAVKLEGADGNLEAILHSVQSGVPVMGHLGLTPQHVHQLGGHRVQGRDPVSHQKIIEDALSLEKAGCFALVLECVPATLAEKITNQLTIPTIGIGAGPKTSGQVLVWQDLLGLQIGHRPKFVKPYLNGAELFEKSLNQFVSEVHSGAFPLAEQCYEEFSYASD